jgi:penicillin-binding protein 2
MVMAYAAIANGGTLYRPQLVRRIEDAEGRVLKSFDPQPVRKIDFKDEYWSIVKDALCGVVNEPGGTAYSKRQLDLQVCGKTGTAQVSVLKKRLGNGAELRKNLEATAYALRDNSWFIGYAPGDAPKIAVVTLTEHGGFGGMASAPTVMAVLRAQLKGEFPEAAAQNDGTLIAPQTPEEDQLR